MRTYEKTHPWINFSLDVSEIPYTTWLLLGEAISKTEHIAGVPLSPAAAQRLHEIYLAKGVLATTAIEGNTLTEEEVRLHLEGELNLPPSREYLSKEIDNVVEACNNIGKRIISDEGHQNITIEEIKEYNSLVLRDLPIDHEVVPGEYRDHSVLVGRYRGAPAEDCNFLMEQFCEWLNHLEFPKGLEGPCSILTAIAAHLYFVWIHPFGDGNGRTARLIEFRFLLAAGFPTPAAHLLSNFYNLTRSEYYRQLDHASRNNGDMTEFIAYATRGLVDQLREQLATIRNLQWDTTWQNYVYECFGRRRGEAQLRRRRLVLDLSLQKNNKGWVQISDIPSITPRLAKEYAQKTSKTLSRDINELLEMHLIQRTDKKVRANRNLILAFLPARASGEINEE